MMLVMMTVKMIMMMVLMEDYASFSTLTHIIKHIIESFYNKKCTSNVVICMSQPMFPKITKTQCALMTILCFSNVKLNDNKIPTVYLIKKK